MPDNRWSWGPSAALMLVGVVGIGAGLTIAQQRAGSRRAARERATDAGQTLAGRVTAYKADATALLEKAASITELRAALDNRVDAETFEDLFETEDWWEDFRNHAVAITRGGKIAVARGIEPAAATAAGARGPSVQPVDSGGQLLVVAVGSYRLRKSGDEFTLIIGRRLDEAALAKLVGPSTPAVAVSDGKRIRLAAGDAAAGAAGARFVGHEADKELLDPQGEWVGAAVALGDGVWVLGVGEKGERPWPEPAIWGGAGLGTLLFLSGVIPLVRRRRSAGGSAPVHAAQTTAGAAGTALSEFHSPVVSRVVPLNPAAARAPSSSPDFAMSSPPRGPSAATALAADSTQQFGRYTLLKRIGEGGMAEVFTAILSGAEGFERLVVIKRLRPHLALNPDAVAQFIDEAKLGSVLTHSNIVTVSDFGKVGDGYFLAAEYVSGHTLAEIAARHAEKFNRSLPAAFVFYMAHEVLAALGYAHERTDPNGKPLGIIHRDVSPTNVMVNFEGEVKLLDFGIVKATERVSRTREGNVKGNVGYMSPEQARGQEVSNRSDLYSLGLVMFDLLAGEPFYRGSGAGEILYQAATGPTAEHLARISALPHPAPEVLRNVLSIDPAGRYPSARAFAQAIGQSMTVAKSQLAELMRILFRS
jgi:hypothetical protein